MDFKTWLEIELEKRNWTHTKLAKKAGFSQAAISLIINGKRKPGVEICTAIAEVFKIPVSVVLRAAGLLPPVPDTEEIIEMTLHEMGFMSTEDRQDMLEYARLRRRIAEERNKYE